MQEPPEHVAVVRRELLQTSTELQLTALGRRPPELAHRLSVDLMLGSTIERMPASEVLQTIGLGHLMGAPAPVLPVDASLLPPELPVEASLLPPELPVEASLVPPEPVFGGSSSPFARASLPLPLDVPASSSGLSPVPMLAFSWSLLRPP